MTGINSSRISHIPIVDKGAVVAFGTLALLEELAWDDLMRPISAVKVGLAALLLFERPMASVVVVVVVTLVPCPFCSAVGLLVILRLLLLKLLVVWDGGLLEQLRRERRPGSGKLSWRRWNGYSTRVS